MTAPIYTADLDMPLGQRIRILRAVWRTPNSPLAVLFYALDEVEQPLGLRIDLDKQRVFDTVGDDGLDRLIQDAAADIGALICQQRKDDRVSCTRI